MADFDFPDICPNETEWGLTTNTRVYQSPLTGALTTAGRRGSRWFTRMVFNNLEAEERRELQAHMVRLNGQEHRSLLHDWSNQASSGGGGGANVNGGGQAGNTLAVLPTFDWVRNGDMFLVNGELKMVTNNNGGGNANIVEFQPPLRTSPPDGAFCSQVRPLRIPMFLVGNQSSWSNSPDRDINNSSSFQLEFIEDIN